MYEYMHVSMQYVKTYILYLVSLNFSWAKIKKKIQSKKENLNQ